MHKAVRPPPRSRPLLATSSYIVRTAAKAGETHLSRRARAQPKQVSLRKALTERGQSHSLPLLPLREICRSSRLAMRLRPTSTCPLRATSMMETRDPRHKRARRTLLSVHAAMAFLQRQLASLHGNLGRVLAAAVVRAAPRSRKRTRRVTLMLAAGALRNPLRAPRAHHHTAPALQGPPILHRSLVQPLAAGGERHLETSRVRFLLPCRGKIPYRGRWTVCMSAVDVQRRRMWIRLLQKSEHR